MAEDTMPALPVAQVLMRMSDGDDFWRSFVPEADDPRKLYTAAQMHAYARAYAAALAGDAARYRWLRDSQNCSLSINHNDHHNMYETLEQVFEHHSGDPKSDYYGDISPEERAAMIAADSLWTLHIYPNTPVGFNVYHGATLDAAIDAAMTEASDGR